MIYFIGAAEAGSPIKVGYTQGDPHTRLGQFQTSSAVPLYLHAFMDGGLDLERELHSRFAEGRLRGEWFRRDTPGLQHAISAALHEEYLTNALAEAEEESAKWSRRHDELVTELATHRNRHEVSRITAVEVT